MTASIAEVAARDGWWCFYCDVALVDADHNGAEWLPEIILTDRCGCGTHAPGEECRAPGFWNPLPGFADATRDHVIPRRRGGSDDLANLVLACPSCNSRKGARSAEAMLA